jgi:hypothetical protein
LHRFTAGEPTTNNLELLNKFILNKVLINEMVRAIVLTSCEETIKYLQ